jgi:hypothetical protein
MANKLTQQALVENMIKLMEVFNDEKVEISEETIHDDVLAPDDFQPKIRSSMNLYRFGLQWIIKRNKGTVPRFPSGWLGISVKALAEFIMSKQ